MALKMAEINLLADKIAMNLISRRMIKLNKDVSVVKSIIAGVLAENAKEEKRIDQKTKELLHQFSSEIENKGVDSSKLFIMAKRKIAKQEGFLL